MLILCGGPVLVGLALQLLQHLVDVEKHVDLAAHALWTGVTCFIKHMNGWFAFFTLGAKLWSYVSIQVPHRMTLMLAS